MDAADARLWRVLTHTAGVMKSKMGRIFLKMEAA